VRTRSGDVPHHTRLPRYARGTVGTVLEFEGRFPLADDVARGLAPEPGPVYAVQFEASDLFGAGDHLVTLDLWGDYLTPLPEE
jgi:nitrile hydratase